MYFNDRPIFYPPCPSSCISCSRPTSTFISEYERMNEWWKNNWRGRGESGHHSDNDDDQLWWTAAAAAGDAGMSERWRYANTARWCIPRQWYTRDFAVISLSCYTVSGAKLGLCYWRLYRLIVSHISYQKCNLSTLVSLCASATHPIRRWGIMFAGCPSVGACVHAWREAETLSYRLSVDFWLLLQS